MRQLLPRCCTDSTMLLTMQSYGRTKGLLGAVAGLDGQLPHERLGRRLPDALAHAVRHLLHVDQTTKCRQPRLQDCSCNQLESLSRGQASYMPLLMRFATCSLAHGGFVSCHYAAAKHVPETERIYEATPWRR